MSTLASTSLDDADADTTATSAHGRVSPAKVFAVALTLGTLTAVIDGRGTHHQLPVRSWTGRASRSDRFLLDHCHGSTIDLGCGPGRLAAELRDRGHDVLGVDASRSAIAGARRRDIPVVCGSLFDPVPSEGSWGTALLADGNIGIGGDPAGLLVRAGRIIRPDGRIVVDLAPAGTGLRVHQLHLRAGGLASTSFPWAELGPDALPETAAAAQLTIAQVTRRRGRTVAVLTHAREQGR
ncbi:class I SAM-dependent DNA methyltransferase [Pedococcus sp. 2YAF34]|uniref:class I SAM-dependent DNA methyltransferase n=1 Tax=Pedococcus sp. 2YAF34 TaxID=3233032 RepID=UPI003F9E7C08